MLSWNIDRLWNFDWIELSNVFQLTNKLHVSNTSRRLKKLRRGCFVVRERQEHTIFAWFLNNKILFFSNKYVLSCNQIVRVYINHIKKGRARRSMQGTCYKTRIDMLAEHTSDFFSFDHKGILKMIQNVTFYAIIAFCSIR